MGRNMSAAIEITGLSKAFAGQPVLNHISLRIEPGELFFLLGPSGCGKTTLLRSIAGFCLPDQGAILVDGVNVTNLPAHARDMGMVFQSYALWPHMTVAENVSFGLEQRKVPAAERQRRVTEALELVRMAAYARRRPNELSGGQQQRVALARALVVRPRCLLLDEPLSNLDAQLRLEMRTEIRRLCKQAELTTVYVTHDQKEALSIADRVAILQNGHIRQCAPPHEIYQRPVSRFVAGFIGETNTLEGRILGVEAGVAEVETAFGQIFGQVVTPDVWPTDGSVFLSIRPECVRLGTPPPGIRNALAGHVLETVYLGEMAQHKVQVMPLAADGVPLELKITEMHPHFQAPRQLQSQAVSVWFDASDVVLLRE